MTKAAPATIADQIEFLVTGPDWRTARSKLLDWPPDVFAIVASILKESGAYIEVVRSWPPKRQKLNDWSSEIKKIASEWRTANGKGHPKKVERWWRTVVKKAEKPIFETSKDQLLWQSLVNLMATADEACAGLGVPDYSGPKDFFSELGTLALWQSSIQKESATLCRAIHFSKLVVLPKMHTPQKGTTIRSLSHHLALCAGADVCIRWYEALSVPKAKAAISRFGHSLSLLLLPYPFEVLPSQFRASQKDPGELEGMDKSFAFFDYHPEPLLPTFPAKLLRLCQEAEKSVGRIDGIVLPEMALGHSEYARVEATVMDRISFLISGVYKPATAKRPGQNFAAVSTTVTDREFMRFEQMKHHRWCLDEAQICQYGLGLTLDPIKKWWEHTELGPRHVNFVSLDSWFCFSVMVCEDLARPDPVANIIRAVGPNLLVALLQDGPQLASRWSSRFATVFADDPGTSVLTLTSLGMATLSRPPGVTPSRVIALWKDRDTGAREIVLPPGHDAVVLSLTNRYERQWSADGRHDGDSAGLIRLAGVHPIKDRIQKD